MRVWAVPDEMGWGWGKLIKCVIESESITYRRRHDGARRLERGRHFRMGLLVGIVREVVVLAVLVGDLVTSAGYAVTKVGIGDNKLPGVLKRARVVEVAVAPDRVVFLFGIWQRREVEGRCKSNVRKGGRAMKTEVAGSGLLQLRAGRWQDS